MPLALRKSQIIAAGLVIAFGATAWVSFGSWAEDRALERLRNDTQRTANQQARLLETELGKFRLLPIALAEYTDLARGLAGADPAVADTLNRKLASLSRQTSAPAIYIINAKGRATLVSNATTPESFVNNDYRFRPYFIDAMRHGSSEYFAVGNVSGRPGLFLSRRLGPASDPIGVVVVKVEFAALKRTWSSDPGTTSVVDARNITLVTTDPAEEFRMLRPLPSQRLAAIERSDQFMGASLGPSRYRFTGRHAALNAAGEQMVFASTPLSVPGWRLIHFSPSRPALREAAALARLAAVTATMMLALIVIALMWRMTRARRAAIYREGLEAAVASRTAALNLEINERTRADLRFREAREELAQANRLASLGFITAGLVHEVNQPVATIRTLAENAQHHLAQERGAKVGESLGTIIGLTERIGAITQEMRRFARRGKGTVESVSLDDVIAGTCVLIGERFRIAGVRLTVPAPGLPHVMATRVRLEQVLVNLLQNALDAISDIDAPSVALFAQETPGGIRLVVADNGPGIPAELAESIFTPFVTGKHEGLGLGLGIARDIMSEFDGTLEIVASPLGGAAFALTMSRA